MSESRLSPRVRDEIVEAYVFGVPVTAIAKFFGVHKTYPGLLAKRRGKMRTDEYSQSAFRNYAATRGMK